ncbi:hypothetical protein B0H14DRAFT_3149306 [Mycena olivaceomarginata]|nr:hypothetical protein B0H14DRAFT_3149306 [Mycena olivaceomarginata]
MQYFQESTSNSKEVVKRSSKSLESKKTKDPILSASRSEFRRSPKIDREKQDVFSIAEFKLHTYNHGQGKCPGNRQRRRKYVDEEHNQGVELGVVVGVKAEVGMWEERSEAEGSRSGEHPNHIFAILFKSPTRAHHATLPAVALPVLYDAPVIGVQAPARSRARCELHWHEDGLAVARLGKTKDERRRTKDERRKTKDEGKGREGKGRRETHLQPPSPHRRRISRAESTSDLATIILPLLLRRAARLPRWIKYNILDQFPQGDAPTYPDVAPISATTSRTTDCSARTDDVPQQGRRHGIFEHMREKKSKCHPAHEEHAKEKGYPCAESGRSRRETSRPSTKYAPPKHVVCHLAQRGSRQHIRPHSAASPAEPPKQKRKKGKGGRGGCMREKEAESRICARKDDMMYARNTFPHRQSQSQSRKKEGGKNREDVCARKKKLRQRNSPAPTPPAAASALAKPSSSYPALFTPVPLGFGFAAFDENPLLSPPTPVCRGGGRRMGGRDEHAGVPAHGRAHLPRILCVHPRLDIGPEEGGARGDWVVGAVGAVGGEIGIGGRRRGRDVRLAVIPVLVLGLERVCVVRHRTKEAE